MMPSLVADLLLYQSVGSDSPQRPRRLCFRADDDATAASFSMAFGLASELGVQGKSVLVICRRGKFEAMRTGPMPGKVVVGPEMIRQLLRDSASQEAWVAEMSSKQVPMWTREELSNVSIIVEYMDLV